MRRPKILDARTGKDLMHPEMPAAVRILGMLRQGFGGFAQHPSTPAPQAKHASCRNISMFWKGMRVSTGAAERPRNQLLPIARAPAAAHSDRKRAWKCATIGSTGPRCVEYMTLPALETLRRNVVRKLFSELTTSPANFFNCRGKSIGPVSYINCWNFYHDANSHNIHHLLCDY